MRADRARDELILTWLRLQAAGWSSYQIGKHYRLEPSLIRTVTSRIRAADQAAEGKTA